MLNQERCPFADGAWPADMIRPLAQRGLTIIELGEGQLGISIEESLLVNPSHSFQLADVKRILRRSSRGTHFRTRHVLPCRSSLSPAPLPVFRSAASLPVRSWLPAPSAVCS